MNREPQLCRGPATRREFLTAGMLGLGGMTLPELFRARARAAEKGAAVDEETSVIFVWMPGGPPHMDMYDMKPKAPSDYRGAFSPIPTNVPGMELCELMPRHAKLADKFSIVRSISHTFADHGGGHKRVMTGRVPATPVNTVNDAPATGSIVAKCREKRDIGIPNYVSMNPGGRTRGRLHPRRRVSEPGVHAVLRWKAIRPLPTSPCRTLRRCRRPPARRRSSQLLSSLDRIDRQIDTSRLMESMDKFQQAL